MTTPDVAPPRRTGAIGKYDAGTVRVIIEALELGMTQRAACGLAHISPETFYTWQETHSEFLDAVASARDVGKREALLAIREAAKESRNWQAAAWYLERSFPAEYRQRVEVIDRAELLRVAAEQAAALGIELPDMDVIEGNYRQLTQGSKG